MTAKIIAELEKSVFPHPGEFTCLVDENILSIQASSEYDAATAAAEYVCNAEDDAWRVTVLNSDMDRFVYLINRRVEFSGGLVDGPGRRWNRP